MINKLRTLVRSIVRRVKTWWNRVTTQVTATAEEIDVEEAISQLQSLLGSSVVVTAERSEATQENVSDASVASGDTQPMGYIWP